jgi:hypothetical protein
MLGIIAAPAIVRVASLMPIRGVPLTTVATTDFVQRAVGEIHWDIKRGSMYVWNGGKWEPIDLLQPPQNRERYWLDREMSIWHGG